MNTLEKTIQAAALALLASQGSCSDVPAVSPQVEARNKDMVDLVKEHWLQYSRVIFKQDFAAAEKSCSAEKRGLTLSLSCYVPSKHPLHKKDGFYFSVDISDFTKWKGLGTERRAYLIENGQGKFEYHEMNLSPQQAAGYHVKNLRRS